MECAEIRCCQRILKTDFRRDKSACMRGANGSRDRNACIAIKSARQINRHDWPRGPIEIFNSLGYRRTRFTRCSGADLDGDARADPSGTTGDEHDGRRHGPRLATVSIGRPAA